MFCPFECECPIYQPYFCLKCKDEARNPLSRCKDCNLPKVLVGDKCVVPSCPKHCVCEGVVPWICTGCADRNADFSEDCLKCLREAKWDSELKKCTPYTKPCSEECICNGTLPGVCTKCVDRFRNLTNDCKSCLESYFINRSGQCSPYRNYCPQLCECRGLNPTLCTNCRDPNRNVSIGCERCKKGYYFNAAGYCTQTCPNGCICSDQYCSGCVDPLKNPSTFCTTCLGGANLDQFDRCISITQEFP